MDTPLAVIGGGNMGKAIIAGAVRSGLINPDWVVVAEPDNLKRAELAKLGVRTAISTDEAMKMVEDLEISGVKAQVLIAIKPQTLPELARDVGNTLSNSDRVVISILAGTPSRRISQAFGGGVRVVRAMPNLPAVVGQATTVVCLGEGSQSGDSAFAESLFRGLGPVVMSTREDLMDAATALTGSGPAYLFYLAEAMEKAGEQLGFTPSQSRVLVTQTLVGACAMLTESAQAPMELRAAVTSKGGTTAAAISVLQDRGAADAFVAAIIAARDRGREIGEA